MAIEEILHDEPLLHVLEPSTKETASLRSRIGRFAGKIALAGVAGATLFGPALMTIFPAETHVGPNEADAYLTLDSVGSLDTGFFGSLNKALQVGGIGVRVDVKGVPNNNDPTSQLVSRQSTEKYLQLLSDPERDQAQVQSDLFEHFAKGTAPTGAVFGMGIFYGLYKLMDPDTRKRRAEQMKNNSTKLLALGGLSAIAVSGVMWGTNQMNHAQERSGNLGPVFKGTELEDVYVKGDVLLHLIRTYGTYVAEGDKFVKTVETNLKSAQEITPLLTPTKQTKTILFEAGMKCNIFVAKTTATIYKSAKPSLFISAGDMAGTGTPLDNQCIEALAFRIKGEKIVSPGNHDSDQAIKVMDENGFEVLDGKIVNMGGLQVLGATNPRVSIPLAGKQQRADASKQTTSTLGDEIASIACNDTEGVDIVVTNEPLAISTTHQYKCAKLVISATRGEHQINTDNPSILLASSSGASDGSINLGKPDALGERTLVEFDSKTGAPLRFQIVQIFPNGNVIIETPGYFNTLGETTR